MPVLKEKGIEAGKDRAEKAVALIKERATFPQELWNLSWFLFKAPEEYEEKGVAKFWKGENPARIAALKEVIAGIDDFTKGKTPSGSCTTGSWPESIRWDR